MGLEKDTGKERFTSNDIFFNNSKEKKIFRTIDNNLNLKNCVKNLCKKPSRKHGLNQGCYTIRLIPRK